MGVKPGLLTVGGLASVTVTFNPDLHLLEKQISALADVGLSVIVDNASTPEILQALRCLLERYPRIALIQMSTNVGLAAALNEGITRARSRAPEIGAVLLLDQDSTFANDVPARLIDALNRVQVESGTLCCVGPALVDPSAGMAHGFHYVAHGWLWSRAYPSHEAPPFPIANLNGSGTTMSLDLIDRIGPLDATLFIDHVDTEWSFRVTSQGYRLFGIPWLSFDHLMGDRGRRLWLFGWRVWPERSPLRHYYLYRNTVNLLGRAYVPRVWKIWAVAKAIMTLFVVSIHGPERGKHWGMMGKGVVDGFRSVRRG
jgi:rhamnosyltransferase